MYGLRGEVREKIKKYFNTDKITGALLFVGIILLLRPYGANFSLGLNEAALVLEIINRSVWDIIFSQSYNPNLPTAPVGFLILEKLAIGLFGYHEGILRLFPLCFSIAGVILFSSLLEKFVDRRAKLFTLSLLVFCGPFIYYSAQVKSYACDVFVAIVLLFYADFILKKQLNFKKSLIGGAIGGAAVWFSYSAVYMLAGISGTLIIFSLIRKRTNELYVNLFSSLMWITSFCVLYFRELGQLVDNKSLHMMWAGKFMPYSLGVVQSLAWFGNSVLDFLNDAMGLHFSILAFGLLVLGMISIFKKDKERFFILISPACFTMIAAALQQYPFYERFLLFLVPSAAILIAAAGSGFLGTAAHTPMTFVNCQFGRKVVTVSFVNSSSLLDRTFMLAPRSARPSRSSGTPS